MRILVSGVHSGPDPSAGVGVARSLGLAFPGARLTGVDYSPASSGIHYEGFQDVWLQRPWSELDLDLYREQIAQVFAEGGLWVSCLDLEALWLAQSFPGEPRLLVPPARAFERIAKPLIAAGRELPVRLPPHVSTALPAWEQHAFCRRSGWPVWCKGPELEARIAWNWLEVLANLHYLREKWSLSHPVLQAHVQGREESVAFCAYGGELLDCVHMRKCAQTAEGKTWAGAISDPPAAFVTALRGAVAELGWTGGGELEMMRAADGSLYLFDWNPRFPAWIHGASLAGRNLPGRLLEAAGAGRAQPSPCLSREFSRLVTEVPVRAGCPLPAPAHPGADQTRRGAEHPSAMVQLGRRLRGDPPLPATPPPEVPGSILADLAECGLATLATPRRVLLPRTARAGFHEAGSLPRSVLEPGVTLHVGYSVKTNPHPALLALALEQGLLAEAITGAEFRHALGCGFRPRQIVLNGPAQGWPEEAPAGEAPFAIFADSLERLEALGAAGVHARFLGPRLRTVPIASRFGIDAGEFGEFSALSGLLARHPGPALGLHFHMASDVLGVPPWRELYAAALRWGCALEVASGRPVRCLDIGGGWFPDDFFQVLVPALPGMLHEAKRLLPRLESFVLEPGKALAQPAMALVTRVLEVRRRHGRAEAVVDGAISDLPQAFHYPHRLLAACRGGPPVPLAGGKGRVLGRNCMEFDGLATEVELPPELAPGDRLVFCDAGAYDATMAYAFGTGRLKDA